MNYNSNTNKYIGSIYTITNNVNGKVYVGQTTQDVEMRWYQHIKCANRGEDYMLIYRAMRKYGIENFDFKEIEHIEEDSYEDLKTHLDTLEIKYIDELNSLKPNGYNMTVGGNNVSDYCYKSVDVYDLHGNFITTYDSLIDGANMLCNGNKNNISACCRGIKMHANCYIWRYHGDALEKYKLPNEKEINKILFNNNIIKINQYTTGGVFINSFSSYTDIDTLFGVKTDSSIHKCCDGVLSSAYGYVWRYSNEPFGKYKLHARQNTKYGEISVYSINDEYINTFNSTRDIRDFLNFSDYKKSISKIYNCMNKKIETAYGYKWFRASDPSQPDKTKIIENQSKKVS